MTTMTRWQPFGEFADLHERLDRLFERMTNGEGQRPWGVVSDLDIARAAGPEAAQHTAGEVACTELVTVAAEDSLEHAAQSRTSSSSSRRRATRSAFSRRSTSRACSPGTVSPEQPPGPGRPRSSPSALRAVRRRSPRAIGRRS